MGMMTHVVQKGRRRGENRFAEKAMQKRLGRVLIALLVGVWGLAALLWILSYPYPGELSWIWGEEDRDPELEVTSLAYAKGVIGISHFTVRRGGPPYSLLAQELLKPQHTRAGFGWGGTAGLGYGGRRISVPFWFVMLLATPGPVALWRRHQRQKERHARRLRGQCASCGYDLRGSRGACPECGCKFTPLDRRAVQWVAASFGLEMERPGAKHAAEMESPELNAPPPGQADGKSAIDNPQSAIRNPTDAPR
jgi:hypothetical protein